MLRTVVLSSLLWALAAGAFAQAWQAPRTPHGVPDLEGLWTSKSFTRLQRPAAFKDLYVAEGEADAWVKAQRDELQGIRPKPKPGEPLDPDAAIGGLESEWYEMEGVGLARIDGRLRSSWIVDPSDGRLPYNSLGRAARDAALRADETDFRGPEVRMPDERCLMGLGSAAGPPMLNTAQNGHYRIVQTEREIAIQVEMIHDVRIVRVGAKHADPRLQAWLGDSVGRWEGDTLVVETVNQHPGSANRFAGGGILVLSPAAKVTERFTRISPTQMRYDFLVEDPALYTQPWRAEMIWSTADGPLYEYACHEGNYAIRNILGGARAEERRAAERQGKAD